MDELERAKAQYRRLVENIREGVSVVNPEGVITSVSPFFEQMLGWSTAELLGIYCQSLIHPADLPEAIDRLQRLSSGQHLPPANLRLLQRSGEYRLVEVLAEAEVDGPAKRIWTLTRDLTQDGQLKRRTEELIRERQRVQSLADLIRDASFSASSHLTTINLATYKLAKQVPTPARLTSVEHIERNVQHLTQLVSRVLTMAELDADRLHFSFTQVDLNRLVTFAQVSISSLTDVLAITLALELTPQLPPLKADELQLYRAIQEVLTNAVQYTPESGKVTLKTFERDGYGVIEVQDTGPGVPPELVPHLFEPFQYFRLPRSGAVMLGLGLPIAKKIIDKHGGSIEITSVPGEGSTVSIAIPLYTP